ncbi:hypothetical protein B0H11DRAFT_2317781 [Mycena galericulata]|nr:hypothetical protein B0H11DRAFT_2317781 [Mycena galericulata]
MYIIMSLALIAEPLGLATLGNLDFAQFLLQGQTKILSYRIGHNKNKSKESGLISVPGTKEILWVQFFVISHFCFVFGLVSVDVREFLIRRVTAGDTEVARPRAAKRYTQGFLKDVFLSAEPGGYTAKVQTRSPQLGSVSWTHVEKSWWPVY